jgi:hypothetical protein
MISLEKMQGVQSKGQATGSRMKKQSDWVQSRAANLEVMAQTNANPPHVRTQCLQVIETMVRW